MNNTLTPDPSVIGRINEAPFALLPDAAAVFARRAVRFGVLAPGNLAGDYLSFLADLSRLQARLAVELAAPKPVPPEQVEIARANRMPPIDRQALVADAALLGVVRAFVAGASSLDMPDAARTAQEALAAADDDTLRWLIGNVLSDDIPADSAAAHLFVAAAVQLHLTRMAAGLDASRHVPIHVGVCPSCGGRPVSSMVVGTPGSENTRYAICATCSTQWNEVRVKCLCCGSTKGIGYRSVDETQEPVIKAEVCDSCHSWVKILYQSINASLEPVADDVASLGLDLMMRETEWKRGGFNPFLVGY